jgi:hypothetical protein
MCAVVKNPNATINSSDRVSLALRQRPRSLTTRRFLASLIGGLEDSICLQEFHLQRRCDTADAPAEIILHREVNCVFAG